MSTKRAIPIAIGLGLSLGAIGILWRMFAGHAPANYGSYIPWGLWIAMYFYFSGITAGAFLLATLPLVWKIRVLEPVARPALLVSLASLAAAMILVSLDLGHTTRAWRVFLHPNITSVMTWMVWMYSAFAVLCVVMIAHAFRRELVAESEKSGPLAKIAGLLTFGRRDLSDESFAQDRRRLRTIGAFGFVLAVAFSGGVGALIGVLSSRPYANSQLMPILFIVSAITTGTAMVTAGIALFWKERDEKWRELVTILGRMTLGFLALDLLLEFAEITISLYSGGPEEVSAYDMMMFGKYWFVFWIGHVALGAILPIAMLVKRARDPKWIGAAAAILVVTFISVRLNLVIPAQTVSQLEGLEGAYQDSRLTFEYFPSLMEWLVGLFAVSVFAAIVGLGSKRLGIFEPGSPGGAPDDEPDRSSDAGDRDLSRRGFLAGGAVLGGGLLATQTSLLEGVIGAQDAHAGEKVVPYELGKPENQVFTVCQQCNTQCGIKAKIEDGVIVKIDGNPYSPWTTRPHLSMDTPLKEAASVDGIICPKGHAGIQTSYDPYRIRKVLKRSGPRGSGKWKTIEFDTAIKEIADGGNLFADIGENRRVPGLRELQTLKDPDAGKEMGGDIKKIADEEMTVADFKKKHAKHLDTLIDPNHPDLGPKNNQFAFLWGRLKDGRGDLIKRFTVDAFGSVNAHGHTTVCQGSLYFSGKAISEKFVEGKWDKGSKAYFQTDLEEAEFVLFVGASPLEANYGPTNRGNRMIDGIDKGRLKIAVVDPRFSKTASKAWKWLPAKPGTEGAMAMAVLGWIIENKRYNEKFLRNANHGAAIKAGEPTWSNAAWLVKQEGEDKGKFLRGSDLGDPVEKRDSELKPGETWEFDPFIVLGEDGKPRRLDPNDEKKAVTGKLLVDTKVNGIAVKSSLQVIKDSADKKSLADYAKICGVEADDIVEIARELTSHGTKASVDVHRGVSQHTNGFYNVIGWFTVNALLGNYDHRGGISKLSTYSAQGDKDKEPIPGKPFVLVDLHPGKLNAFGIPFIRNGFKYDHTTLFKGYPAKRPWFPLSSDVYQEMWPSIGDAYPYPTKAIILYMGSPAYSLPAGHKVIEVLKDPEKLPLFVASDIVVGDTSMYADYIFPDLTNFERWEFAGSHPSMTTKVQPIRQPAIAPIPEEVEIDGEKMPISVEAMLIALASELKLSGFGKDAFKPGLHLRRADDLYLLEAANIAAGDDIGKEVPDISAEDMKAFLASRKHLPKTAFDEDRWRAQVGDKWWPKVAYVLSRGGRFDEPGSHYEGDLLANTYGKQLNLYMEKTASVHDSMSGKSLPGTATFLPPAQDSLGRQIDDGDAYPYQMITFREITHTKSRTISNYWLLGLLPENTIIMNASDAKRDGYSAGDWARIVSKTNTEGTWQLGNDKQRPIVGKVRTMEGLRPGVISFSLGHGHWAYGAEDIEIDGDTVKGDERRGKGIHANAAMRVDPHLGDVTLSDLVGGSAVFYDTHVALERASSGDSKVKDV